MFTEYQIRAALIKTVKYALETVGINGYRVLYRNAPLMTNDNDVVLIDKINTKRRGFQGRDYFRIESDLYEREEWVEEITFQFSIIHTKNVTDTVETRTGEDVAKLLTGWLNSRAAAAYMRGRKDIPFAPIFISQTRTNAYQDENEVHQTDEQFDMTICLVQNMDQKTIHVAGLNIETHPI